MQAFSMSADQAGHAADVFAYAQANANTNVEMIGEAMKYAAPTANQFRWSLEETSAAMMALANQGLKGSIAGQAFASSMSQLTKDKGEVAKKAKALGMEFFDAQEKMKSLPDLIREIEKGTAGMSDKQRVNTLRTLFGAEAFKHWAILLSTGSEELQKMTTALENSDGAAAKMSSTMMDNYGGALNNLQASIQTAQIEFMSPVLPVFQKFFGGISGNIEDNMSVIKKAGEKTAQILSDITEPFHSKPIKPKILPNMDPADTRDMMIQYGKDLKKYNMFKDMDLGDKVIYMLDTATDKMEAWLGGSGGESMTRIFSKLGEIAFKAWLGAFTGSLKAAKDNLMDGNIGGAVGMGAAAWMMGGGLMVKGAIGAGKWGKDIYKSRRATTLPPPPSPTPTPSANPPNPLIGPSRTGTITRRGGGPSPVPSANPFVGPSRTGTINRYGGSPAPPPVPPPEPPPSRGSKILSKVGKAGKFAGKALVPLNIAMEAYNISKSDDKVKATSESVGGLAGGAGGAKIGAAIGTAIAPGIGTAVGGILGGAVGYFGGKWFGGKAVDTAREGSSATAKSSPAPTTPKKATESKATTTQTLDTAPLNASATKLAATFDTANAMMANLSTSLGQVSTTVTTSFTSLQTSASTTAANMDNLTMYSGQVSTDFVTSFYSLKTSTELSSTNMSTLAATIGQANGWISSIQGIQSAANNVITALNNLKTRIDNVQIPTGGGASSRRTQYE